uniref:Uncharacterized protein n=1 Tax=Candidatus Kentrum sp. UNK TaxID=2126344 RepID=A0A451AR45_9GAMM|nr:MAG: hypothetical protein BECKUNK1418G_GA0071005_100436 [Candidatus Kentron sp. UNK]VFK68524.1 MAG: hypothetical protein BECKUNK1418H_GA0071006_100338 [Candidatus Kentron sp. UNK]
MVGNMGNLRVGRVSLCGIATPCLPASLPRSNGKETHQTYRDIAMLTDLERKKVIQHILNLAGIAEDLSNQAEILTEQNDSIELVLS